MNHADYIRKETAISMAINGTLSAAFFLLVFEWGSPVPLWGVGNWVFDFLPQSFMIALMATLVPGAIADRKLRSGKLSPSGVPTRLPRSLAARAVLLALASALGGTALVAALAALSAASAIDWNAALANKIAYGALLAAVVTPSAIRAALSRNP